MAKLVSTNQRIVTGVTSPESVYSRVVSCSHYDPAPPGQDFAYTEGLSSRLWLLGVDVWLDTNIHFATHVFTFSVWRLLKEPAVILDLYNADNVLPLRSTTGWWYWHKYGPEGHFHWDMQRLYEGAGQRFGVVLTGAGAVIAQIQASFRISEG